MQRPLRIRLVTFDIFETLITPREPIHVQYSQVFEPYLGLLPPQDIKTSFKDAIKSVRTEFPAYKTGRVSWWTEVVRQTALGAGADAEALDNSMDKIIPRLLKRFSSSEGYRAFDDAIPTIKALEGAGVRTGVVSNGDDRFGITSTEEVLKSLKFPAHLSPVVLSERMGYEKPDRRIFLAALEQSNLMHSGEKLGAEECLHVGDEVEGDYHGALGAKFKSVLLRRAGAEEKFHIEGLGEVMDLVH